MNTPEVQSGVEQTGGARRPVRTKPFDPYLGAVCAGTWWDLGKLLAHRADPSWIEKRIRGWVRDLHPQVRPHVSVAAVTTFAETLYGVLARKYLGESIAKEANLLTAPIRSASSTYYNDDGEYLDYIESAELFWAIEYQIIFDDMFRPWDSESGFDPDGWLNAVADCHECNRFFVKQRKDQIFDEAHCRIKFANRDAYLRSSRRSGRH